MAKEYAASDFAGKKKIMADALQSLEKNTEIETAPTPRSSS